MANEWFEQVARDKAWVMHVPTGVIGQAEHFYESSTFIGGNGVPVKDPVLKLNTGDTFVAVEPGERFRVMNPGLIALYQEASTGMGMLLRAFVQKSAKAGLDVEDVVIILESSLRMQLKALQQKEPG